MRPGEERNRGEAEEGREERRLSQALAAHTFHMPAKKGLPVAQDGAPNLRAGSTNGGISAQGSQTPETPLSLRGV